MNKEFKIITEGVLLICSSKALINEYHNKAFDYNFPGGLAKLLGDNSIIALTTSEGDDLAIETKKGGSLRRSDFDKIIVQVMHFRAGDELLIMSHADFTMICDKGGDYRDYRWPIKYSEKIDPGNYKIEIGITDVSNEFDKYDAYFKLVINLSTYDAEMTPNQVFEIGE